MTSRWLPALALAALACAGCGDGGAAGPRSVAAAFEEALGSEDGAAACALLAPETRSELEQSAGRPCAEAILGEDLTIVRTPDGSEAYGAMAQVRYEGETLFLAELEDGWRIRAAGCTPAAHSRFDCTIKGG